MHDIALPTIAISILKHQSMSLPFYIICPQQDLVWLSREKPSILQAFLARLSTLPPSIEGKMSESGILARLALQDVRGQFSADLFLSSLTESGLHVFSEHAPLTLMMSSHCDTYRDLAR